jgi:hypothetical protein
MKDRDEQKGAPESPFRVLTGRSTLISNPWIDPGMWFYLDVEQRMGYTKANEQIFSLHLPMNVRRISGSYTVLETDDVIIANFTGTTPIYIPSATGTFNPLYIKLISSGTSAVLTPEGANLIDGQGTYTLSAQYASVMLMPCTFEWNILSNY